MSRMQRRLVVSLAVPGKVLPADQEKQFFPSAEHWKAGSGVLCPVLSPLVQGHYGESPMKGHVNYGTGDSLKV